MKVTKLVWGDDDRTQMEILHLTLQLTPEEDARWVGSYRVNMHVNDVNVDAKPLLTYLIGTCMSVEERIRLLQESLAEAMNTDTP